MSISASETTRATAVALTIDEDTLSVDLADGRTIAVPLAWYPRLLHGSAEERQRWRWIGGGSGVHWPDLDEDVSIDNLLAGKPSGEAHASLARWLAARPARA